MKKTVSIERILFTTIFTAIAVGSTDIKKCLFYENTQCTGDVLTNTTTSSVGQCIAECARNKNCYGLTFHDTILESNCVLCGSSMSLQKKLTTPEVSSAVCRGSEIENVKGCIKLKTGKLIGRYTDIYIDKNSCTQACMEQSSCFAFTWTAKNNSQKNCFLYKDGYRLDVSANETSDTYICKDTNHCHVNLHSCDRNAKCIDLIGGNMTVSHACVCDTDYIGDGSVCRKCIFKDGDGLPKFGGISEHNIGLTATAADCVASCYRLRSVDSFINGATYSKSGVNKNCFCELGMVKRNVDGHWKSCIMEDLPIDGGWSDWSAWSQIFPCFPTCGSSLKTMSRNRSCNNPTPVRNGKPCEGKFNETTFETCEDVKCPPVPYNQRYEYHISTDTLNWWDANTKCKSKPKRFLARFKTPEDFKQIQVKIDNKPYWVGMVDPLNDVNKLRWENSKTYIKGYKGEWHVNEPDQTDEKCVMIGKPNKKLSDMECSNTTHIRYICMTDLRVNGNWSQWSNWTIASTCTPCGKFGTQILERKRRCDNPLPAHTGLECKGNSSEMKTVACMPQPCSTSKISGDVRTEVIVISILLPIILLVPALVLLYMYMKRRKLRADYPNNRATFRAHIPPPRTDTYSDHWEVIPSKIQCLEKIGYGAFGNVYSANLDKDVIKKSMFNNKASPHKKKEIFAVKFLKGKETTFLLNNFNQPKPSIGLVEDFSGRPSLTLVSKGLV